MSSLCSTHLPHLQAKVVGWEDSGPTYCSTSMWASVSHTMPTTPTDIEHEICPCCSGLALTRVRITLRSCHFSAKHHSSAVVCDTGPDGTCMGVASHCVCSPLKIASSSAFRSLLNHTLLKPQQCNINESWCW